MIGSKPKTVARKPHLSASADVLSFQVKGFGRECFDAQRYEINGSVKAFFWRNGANRRDNHYDGRPEYNGFTKSILFGGRITVQHRNNTSGWLSFGLKDTDDSPLLYSFSPKAEVICMYRVKDTIAVFEGTLIDFFQS